jgi:formylglycine-generating enzyme required for sulfatase activity
MNINKKIKNNLAGICEAFLLAVMVLSVGGIKVIGGTNEIGTVKKNSIGMELVYIPAGKFMMGSPETESDRDKDEGPYREITIGKEFWMGKYEVTQAEYEKVMGVNPSGFRDCPRCPVETVSWDDAQEFIKKLNAKNDGFVYRLPTEAEWEYAARAGTKTALVYGDSLSPNQANFDSRHPYGGAGTGCYLVKTENVGSYQPNAWGLYDMHGNVWEWVEDVYDYETRDGKYQPRGYHGLPTDGSAHTEGADEGKRVLRGGGWNSWGKALRSANRTWKNRRDPNKNGGFRIVATAR